MELARRALDPGQNPFLASELRRQARRHSFPASLLLPILGLSALFAALLWIAWQPWPSFTGFMPRFLRPHLVVGIAALHGWLVIYVADAGVRQAAQREEQMWESLVVTPLSAVEIVLFKSVYPFLQACLIALVASPLYVLATAISGEGIGLLLMLFLVYGLAAIRLVTPLRLLPRRRVRRRPSQGAGSGLFFLRLWVWLWVLSYAGLLLMPLSSLAAALFLTWPVVAATLLPTPYPFFRLTLPPLAALFALGPPLFVLNLRAAARRLAARVTEAPLSAPPSPLDRGLMLGGAIALLGYTWPWLIEAGRLSGWMQLGPDAGGSVGALGWLLLAGWWLAYGANSLLTSPHGRTPATEPQPRGVFSGSSEGGPGRGLRAGMAAFLGPPLAVLGLGCLLAGRFPPPFAMAWLGRTALVAAGAAWLTLVLQRRVRDATLARRPAEVAAAWLMVLLLIVAPLTLLFWPEPVTLRVAAVSPAVGFLLALPPKASLSLAALGSLPPWWVTPAVNAGAAALLGHRHAVPERERRSVAPPAPPSRVPARSPAAPGSLGRWVERFATGNDNPVLVQELRLGARRIGSRWQFSSASAAAVICLVALLPVLLLLYDTSIGDYAPGGVPLRDYLQVVTGIAGAIPLHLVPKGLEGFRLFFASVMALLLIGLSWPVLLGAPTQGAVTFSTERRKGRLAFVLLTPLTDAAIVQGKLLGAVAPMLLTLALTFPVAAAAALLSLSPGALWRLLFGYTWLLVACLSGSAIGTLASLRLRGERDPQGLPLLVALFLQGVKLALAARLQLLVTGESWVDRGLEITAWYVVPLVALEAGIGFLAYAAGVATLAGARRRDLGSVAAK